MNERLTARAQLALSDPNPSRCMDLRGGFTPEQLGDPSTFRLTDDGRVIFSSDMPPLETVFKAMELGLRVTLQHADGRKVTFERCPDD